MPIFHKSVATASQVLEFSKTKDRMTFQPKTPEWNSVKLPIHHSLTDEDSKDRAIVESIIKSLLNGMLEPLSTK